MGASGSSANNKQSRDEHRLVRVASQNKPLLLSERDNLKILFDRINEGGVVLFETFHKEVIGMQVPLKIAMPIYVMFCSNYFTIHNQIPQQAIELGDGLYAEIDCLMTHDDLEVFYRVISQKIPSEMAQVGFLIVYVSKVLSSHDGQRGQTHHFQTIEGNPINPSEAVSHMRLSREDFFNFQKNALVGIPDSATAAIFKHVDQYIPQGMNQRERSAFTHRITASGFAFIWNQIALKEYYNWLPTIFGGYHQWNLNTDEPNSTSGSAKQRTDSVSSDRRLSVLSNDMKQLAMQEATQLTEPEITSIKLFYDREIKGREAGYVMKVFQKMFKSVKNDTWKSQLV